MWIRINQIGKLKQKQKLDTSPSWQYIVLELIGLIVFFTICSKIHVHKGLGVHEQSWNKVQNEIPTIIGFAIASAILLNVYRTFFKRRNSPAFSLCIKCDKIVERTHAIHCECGNKLVNSEDYKWIEDKSIRKEEFDIALDEEMSKIEKKYKRKL